jgi:hypothetical protein
MEINYDAFQKALSEENYEDAFHILFRMIKNSDPDALKADKKWTKVARKNSDNKTIQKLEKQFKELPREVKKEIYNKYAIITEKLI